jgi:hypothetical protein
MQAYQRSKKLQTLDFKNAQSPNVKKMEHPNKHNLPNVECDPSCTKSMLDQNCIIKITTKIA